MGDTGSLETRGAGTGGRVGGNAPSSSGEHAVEAASDAPLLAAIVVADGADIERLLEEIVRRLRAAGARLAGFTQRTRHSADGGGSYLALVDLEDGSETPLSAPRGVASTGSPRACTVDDSVLATFFTRTARDLERGVDLVVLNRFGRRECEGRGCRDELAAALERDVPTLCVVRESHADAWRAFGGNLVCCLAPDVGAVHAWFRHCQARRRPRSVA